MLTLDTNVGEFVFEAEGDCCSHTYIDSVEGPTEGVIQDVVEPGWGGETHEVRGEDECTGYYKTTLVIAGKGHLDITYRNEWYYGGSLELVSAPNESTQV